MYIIYNKQSSWIQTIQTGGQPYSDTCPHRITENSLVMAT